MRINKTLKELYKLESRGLDSINDYFDYFCCKASLKALSIGYYIKDLKDLNGGL